ncbi:Nitrilase/cyanide hydratase and apolipoprotein N-acyltransferase [Halovivax asiaticus JCM 14624]|uniref:Nitrilase/cyanide hydratase and apolipoprotein N-acyltransferase n=1 Tax=Halovivax asiaticus JCM 14624 TaxID=1227490 RepID=M0BW00_9EURY|nr:carbon-nitrogen family hydrolase [Halovivax asiaticus]ELZ13839.1 Nitrilase/cyanide hydratase and apolipoprotein N-acyltransferase [Halovivax asiaticus JCM 14624]
MTDGSFRLALAQFGPDAGAVADNRARAIELIERAAARGADLVALPELFSVGYFAFDAYERASEPIEGETARLVADAAATNDVAVLAGTIVEDLAATESVQTPAPSGLANTAMLFDADGERRLVYRKHHLFGYESAESDLLVPGDAVDVAEIGPFTIGVTTCYDLRFPELYRQLVEQGATLVLVPSAWPYPRVEHWQTLTRSRAIENQLYLGAVNGAGSIEESTLLGRSTVYDPWGTPIASTGDDSGLVVADLDPATVSDVRADFPALADRRDTV